jgi:histidine triad (HIT) family protein
MEGCIFCAIVAGQSPAHLITEDDHALAFMDLFPASEGHALVIPKAHSENLFQIDDASVRAVAALARRVAVAMRSVLTPDGMAVYQANGRAAGQTVFHYHVHLIPRNEGSPLTFHGRARADDEGLAKLAAAYAAKL